MQAMYGRHGESPVPIVAAYSPSQCFFAAIEAARIALKYRTPVILLSDGYLANGSEPWRLPDVSTLPDIDGGVRHRAQPHGGRRHRGVLALPARPRDHGPSVGGGPALPASRTASAASRRKTAPGTSTYEAENHGFMVRLREERVAHIANDIPFTMMEGDVDDADLLVLGLGLHVGGYHHRGHAGPGRGAQSGPRPCHPSEPTAPRLGRHRAPLSQGAGPRDEPGPSSAASSEPSTWSMPNLSARWRGFPSPRLNSTRTSTERLMTDVPTTTKADWTSDQEVRWCPGCGDYSILTAVQMLMPELGVRREDTVFISGIGCARPVPLLHEHLRSTRHPRAGARAGHRPGYGPSRPGRVGGGGVTATCCPSAATTCCMPCAAM